MLLANILVHLTWELGLNSSSTLPASLPGWPLKANSLDPMNFNLTTYFTHYQLRSPLGPPSLNAELAMLL